MNGVECGWKCTCWTEGERKEKPWPRACENRPQSVDAFSSSFLRLAILSRLGHGVDVELTREKRTIAKNLSTTPNLTLIDVATLLSFVLRPTWVSWYLDQAINTQTWPSKISPSRYIWRRAIHATLGNKCLAALQWFFNEKMFSLTFVSLFVTEIGLFCLTFHLAASSETWEKMGKKLNSFVSLVSWVVHS